MYIGMVEQILGRSVSISILLQSIVTKVIYYGVLLTTVRVLLTFFIYFNLKTNKQFLQKMWAIYGFHHRVDITEGASAQFPTWIFNFRPYGQLRAVRKIVNYYQLFHGKYNFVGSALKGCLNKSYK